ncbi:MAG: radical SAM protein [Candidatus Diapherotrites archaeon]|nr:radical SAM protein [Candidatus Diapherotrites archaeon]
MACNQNCFFCNVKGGNKTSEIMQISQEKTVEFCNSQFENPKPQFLLNELKSFLSTGCTQITFTGGEPTIRDDLFDLISFAHSKGVKIVVQSNAIRFAYKSYTKALVSAGLASAFISLHSHLEEMSDFLTRSPGTFKKTIAGIHNLIHEGVPVDLNIVVNSVNYRILPEFVEFIDKEFSGSIGRIVFSFVQPYGSPQKNKWIVPKISEVERYLDQAAEKCEKKGIGFSNPFCGVPLCYFYKYLKNCDEYKILSSDPKSPLHSSVVSVMRNKVKSPSCKLCVEDAHCLGVWKSYADIYGTDELRPIQ